MTQYPNVVVSEKIRPPLISALSVSRGKLLRQLDGGLYQRATLVTAPAGFGKTWLVVDWLADHPDVAQSWVTLDPYDNDPMRFLLHMIESVHSEIPDAVDDARSMIAPVGQDPIGAVDALAQSIDESAEHLILVLDDVHLIESRETLACLEACLSELPRSVHIVLVGRREPPIHLARRRVAGVLNEIRTADLRLSLDETRQVIVESLGLELSDEAMRDLHRRTMGWVVGIRLTATAVAQRQDLGVAPEELPSVSSVPGEYQAVARYLFEEAFAQLGDRDIRFLLDTSILRQLTPPLCEAVTAEQDAAALLEGFVASGLFTTRVNAPEPTYRYHDLFREALESRLGIEDPDSIADLHRRAAIWFHQHGSIVDAVEHAIAAGDSEPADDWLVEAVRPLIAAKQGRTLITLLRRLDTISPSLSPSALTGWMAAELISADTTEREVDSVLIRLERKLSTTNHEDPSLIPPRWELLPLPVNESWDELLAVVRALLAYRHGNVEAAAAGDGIPSESRLVEVCAGVALTLLERYPEAESLLRTYLDYTASPKNPIPSLEGRALGLVAKLKAFAGDLAEAERLAASALDLLSDLGLAEHPPAMSAAVAAGWVAWERGQLDTAESSIAQVIETIDRFGEMPTYVLAGILTARTRWSKGDHTEAHQALDRVKVSPGGRDARGHLADRIAMERARFALLEGDLIAAELAIPDWRQRIERGPQTMRHRLVLARMTISTGGDATALLGVEPFDSEFTAARIEIHKLRALAAMAANDATAALDQLTQAMLLAAHTGHRQTFIDDQATFGGLLDNAIARSGHWLRLSRPSPEPPEPTRYADHPAIEPLSDRELEILRLLPTQLANREIGDLLWISTNTVKFHIRNIYRKLEAKRRTEAVEVARSAGLID